MNELPSCFIVAGFNSMAVEAHLLKDRGTESVITMILKAGKSTSHWIYYWDSTGF